MKERRTPLPPLLSVSHSLTSCRAILLEASHSPTVRVLASGICHCLNCIHVSFLETRVTQRRMYHVDGFHQIPKWAKIQYIHASQSSMLVILRGIASSRLLRRHYDASFQSSPPRSALIFAGQTWYCAGVLIHGRDPTVQLRYRSINFASPIFVIVSGQARYRTRVLIQGREPTVQHRNCSIDFASPIFVIVSGQRPNRSRIGIVSGVRLTIRSISTAWDIKWTIQTTLITSLRGCSGKSGLNDRSRTIRALHALRPFCDGFVAGWGRFSFRWLCWVVLDETSVRTRVICHPRGQNDPLTWKGSRDVIVGEQCPPFVEWCPSLDFVVVPFVIVWFYFALAEWQWAMSSPATQRGTRPRKPVQFVLGVDARIVESLPVVLSSSSLVRLALLRFVIPGCKPRKNWDCRQFAGTDFVIFEGDVAGQWWKTLPCVDVEVVAQHLVLIFRHELEVWAVIRHVIGLPTKDTATDATSVKRATTVLWGMDLPTGVVVNAAAVHRHRDDGRGIRL